ncbi:ABC transporter substrate-binding protein [Streptomyces sp. ODS28]|uniref:ABC transporter substrate-binding protein n=1 Tax=Streptomyces sp. ODS28 TaxID=3136688 RepID=UPI0031EF1161
MTPALGRRRFLAAAGAAATTTALGGCAGLTGGYAPDGLVVHSQLGGNAPGAPAWARASDAFRRQNPHMPLKVLTNADDLQQVYETAKLAGKEADVVLVNLWDKALAWTDVGATVPVNRYLDAWGLRDRVIGAPLREWTDKRGRIQGFPFLRTNWPVVFNEKLLHSAGVAEIPRTHDALIDAAKKLRRKRITPVAIGGNDWSGQKLLLQIMQAYVRADEAKHVMASGDFSGSPGARRGIELFVELRDAGVFGEDAQGVTSDLMTTQVATEKAASASLMSSAMAKIPNGPARHMTVGGFPVPGDAVYPKPTIMRANASQGIWVSPNGERKIERVERFVRFMYSEETVRTFVHGGRDVALHTDALSTGFPLVAQGQRLGEGEDSPVSEVVCPDIHIPAAVTQPLIQATGTAFGPGAGARKVRTAMEHAYRSTDT